MSYLSDRIDTFSPIKWESGKNSEEKHHWLGRIVEPYFDLGQQSYTVHHNPSDDGIPVYKDTKKSSWQQTALKVVGIIFKVLSYLTVIIPLVMLIGKSVYRSNNTFVQQDRVDPKEHERMANQIYDRYSSEKDDNHHARLSTSINEFALQSCDTPESLDYIASVYKEIDTVKQEIVRLKALKREDESEEVYNNLDDVTVDLNELLEIFNASIEGDVHKNQMLQALEASYLLAVQAVTGYREELDVWKEVQDEVLDGLEPQDWIKKFDELVVRSQNMGDYQLGNYSAIEKFLKHHALIKKYITDFEHIKKYDDLDTLANQILKPDGIPNLGHTCYMNSLLQSFANEPALIDHLNRNFGDNDDANRIVHSLKVFVSAHRSGNGDAIEFAANGVRELLFELGIIQHRTQQNDASEVLQMLMMFTQFPTFKASLEKSYEDGELKGVVESKDDLNSLSLSIKSDDMIESDFLQGIVDKNFTKKEMKDRLKVQEEPEVYVQKFEEQSFFDAAPDSLVLSLKRFQREGDVTSKIPQHIKMPINGLIDLTSAFKGGVVPDEGSPMYEITSVVRHHGAFGGGHYTGSVNKGTDWIRVNDSRVYDNDTTTGQDGYMYFLRRVTA